MNWSTQKPMFFVDDSAEGTVPRKLLCAKRHRKTAAAILASA
jgi:hypothetical protein